MIVTVTEVEAYKRCRRKWDYSAYSRQSLQAIVPRSPLTIGTLIHRALADWIVNPGKSPAHLFVGHTGLYIEEAKAAYEKQVGAPMSDDELQPIYDVVELGIRMMQNYQRRWSTPLPDGFRVVRPEQQVIVPIPNTEHSLEARLDAIVEDDKGNLYVLEHKTYASRPRPEVLAMNTQFVAYTWVLKRLDMGPVGGVAYDGLWKRPEPPKGSTFNDMFLRAMITFPDVQLLEFEQFLSSDVREMASSPVLSFNRRWEGCYDCDFERACRARSRGEDEEYILKHYYTLRERSLDPNID